MPKSCKTCDLLQDYDGCMYCPFGDCPVFGDIEYVPNHVASDICPLVELPEKHGRLIDADELIDYCKDMIRIISESDDDMINIITSRICYASVIGQIINMTTIFEAEGE